MLATLEDQLASLFDDKDFRDIYRRTRKFNIFEALGAVRGELRHSNFLAFLLSPNRPHGLGDEFLRHFLRASLGRLPTRHRPLRSLELVTGDIDDAVIYREHYNIDILIELKNLNLVVLIENKIDALASDGQLARYKRLLEANYPGWRRLAIFLTPKGAEADENDFVSMSYSTIAEILESAVHEERKPFALELSLILRHYVEMLRRHIVEDEKLIGLARKLYERHKEALDFIIEHRPRPQMLLDSLRELLKSEIALVEDVHTPSILRFALSDWADIPQFNACPKQAWTHSGRSLLFEIKVASNPKLGERVWVCLVLGPAEAQIRRSIYDHCVTNGGVFVNRVSPMGERWSTVFSRDFLTTSESRAMEPEDRQEHVERRWREFLEKDLPKLANSLRIVHFQS